MKPATANPILGKARTSAFLLTTRIEWPNPDESDALEHLARLMESEKVGIGKGLRAKESAIDTEFRLMNTVEKLALDCFPQWWGNRGKLSEQIPWLYRVVSEIERFVNEN